MACKGEAKRSEAKRSEAKRRKRIRLSERFRPFTKGANFDPDTGYLDIWTYLVCTFRFAPPPPRFVTIYAAALEVDEIRPDPIRAASCSHASECRLISR